MLFLCSHSRNKGKQGTWQEMDLAGHTGDTWALTPPLPHFLRVSVDVWNPLSMPGNTVESDGGDYSIQQASSEQ